MHRSYPLTLALSLVAIAQTAASAPASNAFEARKKDFDRQTLKAEKLRLSASKAKVGLHVQHERVVSEVGSLTSVEEEWLLAPCGNSGTVTCHGGDLWTIDVSKPERRPSLLDYYSEAQVVAALKASPQVKEVAQGELANAATLAAISRALVGDAPEFLEENHSTDALVTHFGFVRGDDGGVVVRLEPRHAWQSDGSFDVTLPIPEKLAPAMAAAQRGTAGFMMENGPADAGQVEFRWVRPGFDAGGE